MWPKIMIKILQKIGKLVNKILGLQVDFKLKLNLVRYRRLHWVSQDVVNCEDDMLESETIQVLLGRSARSPLYFVDSTLSMGISGW